MSEAIDPVVAAQCRYSKMLESEQEFMRLMDLFGMVAADSAQAKGFVTTRENVPEKLCLIHSEISEALEAHRTGNGPDSHLPAFDGLTVELADAVIRIINLSGALKLQLGAAIVAKMAYNRNRPHKHGKVY